MRNTGVRLFYRYYLAYKHLFTNSFSNLNIKYIIYNTFQHILQERYTGNITNPFCKLSICKTKFAYLNYLIYICK